MKPMRRYIVKKFVMALWGLFTLILLFSVVLLAYEMLQGGQAPLSTLRPAANDSQFSGSDLRRSTAQLGEREVLLYFSNRDGTHLRPYTVPLPYSESTVENCRVALDALIAGPSSDQYAPVLPDSVRVRALYLLDDGELVIDLSRELLTDHAAFTGAGQESLLVYGIVNTLTQGALQSNRDPQVRHVRILVEGLYPETFPAHVDVSEPLPPDNRWLESSALSQPIVTLING